MKDNVTKSASLMEVQRLMQQVKLGGPRRQVDHKQTKLG
jgi:hypothetical protein